MNKSYPQASAPVGAPVAAPAASPYAPPRAALVDRADERAAASRPPQLARALRWAWAAFAIGIAYSLYLGFHPDIDYEADSAWMVGLGIDIVYMIALAVTIRAFARGLGWARIAYVALVSLSVLLSPLLFYDLRDDWWGVADAGFAVLMDGCGIYSAVLLFTGAARQWFREIGAR